MVPKTAQGRQPRLWAMLAMHDQVKLLRKAGM